MKRNIVENLIYLQRNKYLYPFAHIILAFLSLEIPKEVTLGRNVRFVHRSPGTVIHPNVKIEDNVHIYQNVTIGLAKPWKPAVGGGSN